MTIFFGGASNILNGVGALLLVQRCPIVLQMAVLEVIDEVGLGVEARLIASRIVGAVEQEPACLVERATMDSAASMAYVGRRLWRAGVDELSLKLAVQAAQRTWQLTWIPEIPQRLREDVA